MLNPMRPIIAADEYLKEKFPLLSTAVTRAMGSLLPNPTQAWQDIVETFPTERRRLQDVASGVFGRAGEPIGTAIALGRSAFGVPMIMAPPVVAEPLGALTHLIQRGVEGGAKVVGVPDPIARLGGEVAPDVLMLSGPAVFKRMYGRTPKNPREIEAKAKTDPRFVESLRKEDLTKAEVLPKESQFEAETKAISEEALRPRTPFDTPEIIDARATQKAQPSTHLINTPERQALRDRLVAEAYGQGALEKGRRADLITGPPGAGKSTIFVNPLAQKYGSLIIDSDAIKPKIPESQGGKYAGVVHEESSQIADRVLAKATEAGDNIVLPLVGKNSDRLERIVRQLKTAGYAVHLHHVDLPLEKAAARVVERFLRTNRFVDPEYVLSLGLKPWETYNKLKKEVTSYEAYSNDVGRGEPPRLIERSGSAGATGPDPNLGSYGAAARGRPLGGYDTENPGQVRPEAPREQTPEQLNRPSFERTAAVILGAEGRTVPEQTQAPLDRPSETAHTSTRAIEAPHCPVFFQ
jgi:predicted ABC-type ATPase